MVRPRRGSPSLLRSFIDSIRVNCARESGRYFVSARFSLLTVLFTRSPPQWSVIQPYYQSILEAIEEWKTIYGHPIGKGPIKAEEFGPTMWSGSTYISTARVNNGSFPRGKWRTRSVPSQNNHS